MEQLPEEIFHIVEPFYRYSDDADDHGEFFEGVHNRLINTTLSGRCHMV